MRPDLRRAHPEAPREVKAGSRVRHGGKFSSIRGQRLALLYQDQCAPACVCVCWVEGVGSKGLEDQTVDFPC